MRLGKKQQDDDVDIEDTLDQIRVESAMEDLATKKSERKMFEKRMKAQYGPNWKRVLNNVTHSESLSKFGGARFKMTDVKGGL